MPSKNKPRYVEFKGEHPYFVSGECYTHKEYSDWTQQNHEDGGKKKYNELEPMESFFSKIETHLYQQAFGE